MRRRKRDSSEEDVRRLLPLLRRQGLRAYLRRPLLFEANRCRSPFAKRDVEMRLPYDGAKDYFYIADVDDSDYLSRLVRETCKILPAPKPKKRKR